MYYSFFVQSDHTKSQFELFFIPLFFLIWVFIIHVFPLKRYLIKWRHLFRCIVQKINGSDSRCDTNGVVNTTNKHEINIFFCSLSHSFFILILSILLKMNTIKLCFYAKWVHLVTYNLMPCHTYFNYYTNFKTSVNCP